MRKQVRRRTVYKAKTLNTKLSRKAEDKYYEDEFKEMEMLDKVCSQLLYKKIKELKLKGNRMIQTIKNKKGKGLLEKMM